MLTWPGSFGIAVLLPSENVIRAAPSSVEETAATRRWGKAASGTSALKSKMRRMLRTGGQLTGHSVFIAVFLSQDSQVLTGLALLVGQDSRSLELMIGDGVDHASDVGVNALLSLD